MNKSRARAGQIANTQGQIRDYVEVISIDAIDDMVYQRVRDPRDIRDDRRANAASSMTI